MDANKARDELKAILDHKEYTVYYHDSKGLLTIVWEKAKHWLGELLAKLFPSFNSASGTAGPILIVIIAIVLLLLVVSVIFLMRHYRRDRNLRNQKPLTSRIEIDWSVQQHINEAKRLETLGEYTHSTRHLFLALLLYFHEKEWLEARIWKTNWEYYDELRKVNKQMADEFYQFAQFFDKVTYGERKVEKDEYLPFKMGVMEWLREVPPFGENRAGENP